MVSVLCPSMPHMENFVNNGKMIKSIKNLANDTYNNMYENKRHFFRKFKVCLNRYS